MLALVLTLACHPVFAAATASSSTSKKRQVGLEDSFLIEKKLKLDRDLSKGHYQGNVSLGVFDSNPHLRRTIQELAAAAGMPGYAPPNRYRMSKELLDHHWTDLTSKIRQRMQATVSPITSTFDGWDNASKTHLLGVMAVTT